MTTGPDAGTAWITKPTRNAATRKPWKSDGKSGARNADWEEERRRQEEEERRSQEEERRREEEERRREEEERRSHEEERRRREEEFRREEMQLLRQDIESKRRHQEIMTLLIASMNNGANQSSGDSQNEIIRAMQRTIDGLQAENERLRHQNGGGSLKE